jgi:glycosyltransferase involved in cell wall biosynthesis
VIKVLIDRGLDVQLDLLGEGELFEQVKSEAANKGLSDHIHFRGSVDDVESYLKKANLYIHPAYYEPFGLVIIEAMAAGLPVICLDGKGNRDLIEQGKNGYMIYEQDPQLFADKIVEILGSEDEYSQLSTNAVEYARQFDIRNHVDRLLNYYQTI